MTFFEFSQPCAFFETICFPFQLIHQIKQPQRLTINRPMEEVLVAVDEIWQISRRCYRMCDKIIRNFNSHNENLQTVKKVKSQP